MNDSKKPLIEINDLVNKYNAVLLPVVKGRKLEDIKKTNYYESDEVHTLEYKVNKLKKENKMFKKASPVENQKEIKYHFQFKNIILKFLKD